MDNKSKFSLPNYGEVPSGEGAGITANFLMKIWNERRDVSVRPTPSGGPASALRFSRRAELVQIIVLPFCLVVSQLLSD